MSKYVYNELVKAGAPELVEGLFYRVGWPGAVTGVMKIEIRRRRRWWFSKRYHNAEWLFNPLNNHLYRGWSTTKIVAYNAKRLHDNIADKIEVETRLSEARSLVGDHP